MLHLYKTVLLAFPEDTQHKDANPIDTDAILAYDVNITPLETEQIVQQPVSGQLGSYRVLHAGARARIRFHVDLAPAKTASDKPPFSSLLEACGLGYQLNAEVQHQFLLGDTFPTVRLFLYCDGVLHRIDGALGNVEIKLEMHQRAIAEFEFLGIWKNPTLETAPQSSFTRYGEALMLDSQHCQISLNSTPMAANSLQINVGNSLEFHETFTEKSVLVTARRTTASLLYQAEHDNLPEQGLMAGSNTTLGVILHDQTRRITLDMPYAQWQSTTLAQQQGLWWRRGELAISDSFSNRSTLNILFDIV